MCNRKIYDKKYRESIEGRIVHRRAMKRYRESVKGKETALKYDRTSKGRLMKQRKDAKRRDLGWIVLNKQFGDCVGHHISENFVIYIPKEMHQSLYHNLWTWQNMEIMNKCAFKFAGII